MILKINRDDLCYAPIYLMILGWALILFCEPLGLDFLVSIATWIIVLSSIYTFFQKILFSRMINKVTLILFCLIACVCFSTIADGDISYSAIVSVGCFLEIPIFVCAYQCEMKESVRYVLYIINVFLCIYFIILSLSPLAYKYINEWGVGTISDLTLSYGNPNEAAMYLFSSIIILTSSIPKIQNKYLKKVFEILNLVLYCLVFLTRSRTAIIISLLFAVLCFLHKNRKVKSWLMILIFFVPLVFVWVLLFFQESIVDVRFLGDSFDTGRRYIYLDILDGLSVFELLIGNFSYRFTNLHNAFLAIFATIGMFGSLAFYCILYSKLKTMQEYAECSYSNKVAYIGLLCMVLHTTTEAAFFVAGSAFAMSFINVYILCLPEKGIKM